MLMVTTTVRMVNGVHGDTSGLGPRVSLHLVLVESSAGLQQWLVNSTTAGNNTNDTSSVGRENLLGARWQLDSGLALVGVVANDDEVVTGGSAQGTSVTSLLLNVGDDGTFGHGAEGQHVTDVQRSLLTGVNELASVDTLVGNESLLSDSVLVGVSEGNLGKRSTSTWVVDDQLDDTTDVAVTLSVVQGSQLGSTLSQPRVGGEDGTSTLPLITNNST